MQPLHGCEHLIRSRVGCGETATGVLRSVRKESFKARWAALPLGRVTRREGTSGTTPEARSNAPFLFAGEIGLLVPVSGKLLDEVFDLALDRGPRRAPDGAPPLNRIFPRPERLDDFQQVSANTRGHIGRDPIQDYPRPAANPETQSQSPVFAKPFWWECCQLRGSRFRARRPILPVVSWCNGDLLPLLCVWQPRCRAKRCSLNY